MLHPTPAGSGAVPLATLCATVPPADAAVPEDEAADPVGDGHSDADFARRCVATPRKPGHTPLPVPRDGEPPVEPDQKEGPGDGQEGDEDDPAGIPR